MKKVLFILILCALVMGCDPVTDYHFALKNDTTSNIKVKYQKISKDTFFFIKPNEAKIIQSSLPVTKPGKDYYKGRYMPLYQNISVTKNTDSLNINIWKRENWVFYLKDTLKHMYVLELKEKHFANKG